MTENKKTSDDERSIASKSIWQNEMVRRWGIRVMALFAAFLLGFVPMWLSSRGVTKNLDQAKVELRRHQLENSLAIAVIEARRGKYEIARQNASNFFGEVRNELDNSDSVIFNTQERTKISEMYSVRDEIITLLSRGDSAGAERLNDFYFNYRDIVAPL
jgi:hypothetical protein